MQILALDTASPVSSVTLLARGVVWEEALPGDRRASEELLPAIERCFAAAGSRLPDCDRIAVCSGPGSFTGLRIGLATAWGLGRAAGIPVETVSISICSRLPSFIALPLPNARSICASAASNAF